MDPHTEQADTMAGTLTADATVDVLTLRKFLLFGCAELRITRKIALKEN